MVGGVSFGQWCCALRDKGRGVSGETWNLGGGVRDEGLGLGV